MRRSLACVTLCALLGCFLALPAAAADFQDVPPGHWAAVEIQECVDLGFFKGQSAYHFGLGESMTRAAFAVVLCRFFGWETVSAPAQSVYSDVPADAWYAGAVEAAFTNGALTRQEALFRPNDPITREELTVTLLRAMDYSVLAGLSGQAPLPFTDVTTNTGYISLAYELGLMNGTTATTFSPERQATREQVAVILMRLYRKLHQESPDQVAILPATETLPDLTGVSVAAIPAARLLYISGQPKVNAAMEAESSAALHDAARQAGVPSLLHVTGGITALNGTADATASALVQAVEEQKYDGLFLDIPKLKGSHAKKLTALATELRKQLGDKPLYLMAEAPSRQGNAYSGYDFSALSPVVDRIILRVASYSEATGNLMVAPVAPLEEVYHALTKLRGTVPPEKLFLLFDTSGSVWTGKKQSGTMTGAEIQTLLSSGEMYEHYSSRYACAYLTGASDSKKSVTVWYLNATAASQRLSLLHLLGVNQVCIADFSTTTPDVLSCLE